MLHAEQSDNLKLARQMYESFNSRDIEGAVKMIADSCEWENVATGETYRGKQGFRQFFQNWLNGFPDGKIEVTNVFNSGDRYCVEFTGRGTHSGTMQTPMGPLPATNKRVEEKFCDVFEMKNGQVLRGRSYWDVASMMKQLGLMPMTRQAGQ